MMTNREFAEHLTALRLSQSEAAQLLGVSERSVRRWTEGEAVPGPAEAAIRAWRSLDERHLPWKPDSVSIFQDDQDQLRRMREHDNLLAALMTEVEQRGGPTDPWTVDLAGQKATLGPAEVGFHVLQNGGFSPSTFRRLDRTPSVEDTREIQDAVYCIALAFARARAANKALIAVAEYTRQHAQTFVTDGPARLSVAEAGRRQQMIVRLADRFDTLAVSALEGDARYQEFETTLGELHRLGFYPEMSLVSAVARGMTARPGTLRDLEGRDA